MRGLSVRISVLFLVLLAAANTTFAAALDDGKAAFEKGDYERALSLWRPLAEQGNAEAQRDLGWMYETAKGVARDEAQATQWYSRAAEQGDAKAQYRLGVVTLYGHTSTPVEHELGLSWFEKAASQGYAPAQRQLGAIYEVGDFGVPKNDALAVSWFRNAAEQSDVPSLQRLVSRFEFGHDATTPRTWTRKLAELGDLTGEYFLGLAYIHGLGVPEDRDQAIYWLEKAASQHGFSASLAKVSLEQIENPNPPLMPPPPDFDAIRSEALSGNAKAQHKLGEIYQDKNSTLHDDAASVVWLRKAADQRYAPAEASLADLYFAGKGLPKSDELFVYWLRRAAEDGNVKSQLKLSTGYSRGWFGLPKDEALGLKWKITAANTGNDEALLEMGRTYQFGRSGVSKDQAKAMDWFQQAAEHGNIQAQYWLGMEYERGRNGVPKDIDKALFWLRKAADHDDGDITQEAAEQALTRLEKGEPPLYLPR
jgi:TPR repeat protein